MFVIRGRGPCLVLCFTVLPEDKLMCKIFERHRRKFNEECSQEDFYMAVRALEILEKGCHGVGEPGLWRWVWSCVFSTILYSFSVIRALYRPQKLSV